MISVYRKFCRLILIFVCGCGVCFSAVSCTSSDPYVTDVDPEDRSAYYGNAMLQSGGYSFRTMNFLRANLYLRQLMEAPEKLLNQLESMDWSQGRNDQLEILCDIAYNLAERHSGSEEAIPYYLSSALYAYRRLFAEQSNDPENEPERFDPSCCQILLHYNASVAKIYEYLREKNLLEHDSFELKSVTGERVYFRLPHSELPYGKDYVDIPPCSAFEIHELSLINQHFGMGVPLVALANPPPASSGSLLRNVPKQPMPATLVLDFDFSAGKQISAQFSFYDTFITEQITRNGEIIPLARDYSTPIATMSHCLPVMTDTNLITTMLNPDKQEEITGLYLLEPYNPEKIPVVFVHGLMSSPETWIRMINFLRHYPYVRKNYQFWFYKYSSGNPVLISAETLRKALLEAEKKYAVTPEAKRTFSRMILAGHSMGGLISRVITQDKAEYFVEQYTGEKWADFSAGLQEDERKEFQELFFRKPDFVSRLIMMAVPHRGSSMAKWSIARFFSNLVSIPTRVVTKSTGLFKTMMRNSKSKPEDYKEMMVYTGIDNLDPDNRFIRVLSDSAFASDIPRHSIIGNNKAAYVPGGTDGVVPYSSSHVDGVDSELIVKSGHSVHQTPEAMRELARILLLHLKQGRNPEAHTGTENGKEKK